MPLNFSDKKLRNMTSEAILSNPQDSDSYVEVIRRQKILFALYFVLLIYCQVKSTCDILKCIKY